MYEYSAKPIIDSVFEGFNGTIFTYGQTSSGKTFTMQGVIDDPELQGIIPRIVKEIFQRIFAAKESIQFTVTLSMIEIYMEKIKDLIEPSKINLNIREDKIKGIYVDELSEIIVDTDEEMLKYIKKGMDSRSVAFTNMNENSSRSHSIVLIQIKQVNLEDLSSKLSKFYLIDLAGSEKISKTGANGTTLDEAKMINKSLTCLGMVINCLTETKQGHIPYRDSKLTRILQDSLGGSAKTSLIIACSPSNYNEAETLSTLRFGLRAKKIKNKPQMNKETSTLELKNEIQQLEKELDRSKHRIIFLENFLEMNQISFPKEVSEFDTEKSSNSLFDKEKLNSENSKIKISIKTTNNYINNTTIPYEDGSDFRKMNSQNIDDLNVLISEFKYEKDIQNYLKEKNNLLSQKINEIQGKIMSFEEVNKKLTFQNHQFRVKIDEMNILIESKNKIIDELNIIIDRHEYERMKFRERIEKYKKKINKLTNQKSSFKLKKQYLIKFEEKDQKEPELPNLDELDFTALSNIKVKKEYNDENPPLDFSAIKLDSYQREHNQLEIDKSQYIRQENSEIIKSIDDQIEKKSKVLRKYKQYAELAGNFIFSNWNLNNFKNGFKNAYSGEKL